jgi:phosphoserine phosphatase RsbU/P
MSAPDTTRSGALDPAHLRLLYELGCAFAARTDLDELNALVIAKCREVMDAEGAAILLFDAERDELYFPYVADEDAEASRQLAQLRFPANRGVAGEVLRSGRAVRVDDATSDPRVYRGVDRRTGLTTRTLISAPLSCPQGTIGVIQVLNRRGGACFTDDDLAFLAALAGSVAVAIDNARLYAQIKEQLAALQRAREEHDQLVAIRHELDIARSIQQSILPRTFPAFPQRTDFDLFGEMIPAREVGGDFYDFFLVDEARLGLVIGDVSGKGMPAALFMAISRSLLKSTALKGQPPDECLQHVNRLLCLDNASEMFVTVVYALLDTRTGVIEYSNGGHNPPYVLRHGGIPEPLEGTGGMVLGAIDTITYRAKHARLQPGDGLFLYTDGVTEAMDCDGQLYSDDRLRRLLRQVNAAAPAQLVRDVIDDVKRHSGSAPQSDDITTLALCYRG